MQVVLDTNVLPVSISDRSPYHWIYQNLLDGKYTLCVTTDIVLEYTEVLQIHMGKQVSKSVEGVLENLPNVRLITSYFKFGLIKKDVDDNKFVDCAIASNAYCIVSEDKDFNILSQIDFPKVLVLRIVEFEQLLNSF